MKRSKLGYAVWVLYHRLWDTKYTNPPFQSRKYWKEIKRKEMEGIHVCESFEPYPEQPVPIPLEIEFGMPNLNYEMLNKVWPQKNRA